MIVNCNQRLLQKHFKMLLVARMSTMKKEAKENEALDAKSARLSPDIINYLDNSSDYIEIKDKIPKALLKKYKTPENMYLINKKTAKEIATSLKGYLTKENPLIEVNPGLGFLSEELLLQTDNHIYMYESAHHFSKSPLILEVQRRFGARITYKEANFFAMGKLAFQDKIDNGERLKELLGELITDNPDRMMNIVGAMPGIQFLKHLINNIIFHNTHQYLGRTNMFMAMPINQVETLTNLKTGKSKILYLPSIFNLFFDCKVISRLPQVHYLPWITHPKYKTNAALKTHFLYLVNISQKREMPCAPDYLPLLWYFFRPITMSASRRIIPTLEQWIPGCGVWLITGMDPPETNAALGPTQQDAKLPQLNIFTQFGDLDLQQKLTIFKRFISWPEFEQCPFRATMENNFPKSYSAIDADDDKDKVAVIGDEGSDDESDSES